MEDMDIDHVVDVPDTPDRIVARRATGRESLRKDHDSSLPRDFRNRDILYESPMSELRSKDKLVSENGRFRKLVIHPPKGFGKRETTNISNHNVLSSLENSSASQNAHLFRRAIADKSSGHRAKHSSGAINTDKGKSICTDRSSSYLDGIKVFDFPKQNDYTEHPKTGFPYGAPKQILAEDKRNGKIALSGSSSGPCIPDSSKTFRNACKGKEKIDENAGKAPGLDMVRGEVVILSPDSQQRSGEDTSTHSVTSLRVTGKKSLVRNGCISPQNVAKAQQPKNSSKNIERSDTGNGVRNFPISLVDISDIIGEENDSVRVKGKAVSTIPDAPKEQNEKPFLASSSSFASGSEEAKGISNGSRDEGLGGWRSTRNHSRKLDNNMPDAAGPLSWKTSGVRSSFHQQHETRLDRRDYGSRQNFQTKCDNPGGPNAAVTAPFVFDMEQSSGPPRAEKTITKRLKKQGSPSRNHGECSTSISEDSDVFFIGSSKESTNTRSSRLPHSQSRAISGQVIELDGLSPPVRRSTPQVLDCANNDDSDARARQVEADEILARELQEQLYHEMPIVGGGEIDEHFARALQRQENGTSGVESHPRGSMMSQLQRQPRSRSSLNRSNRTQNHPNRRATQTRVPSSSRMAQLRNRMYRQHFAVSNRGRNLQFPLDMDLDMRLDILEALEAAVGDLNDADMGNHIFQVQRDFNENDYEMLLALDDQNHQHSGASVNQINSLPQSVVQTENLEEACAICLENPTTGETVRHLPCLHKFHKECIDPWLSRRTSCPICKCSIT
ncbi:43kDa postsynaptic protein [Trema orientale]|uniref:43kDa postsynaptic protein n=1 Tax=Trema orientale TaxID=63057 RepID=A0A2P5CYI5_TREOI|nr:43kDa postsynaptic protein [Trema orientale]